MTTTFDATLTLTPDLLAGTALVGRPHEAVEAVRSAIERLRGAAWIDVEWWDVAEARLPMVKRVVVRGELEEGTEDALKQTMDGCSPGAQGRRLRRSSVTAAPAVGMVKDGRCGPSAAQKSLARCLR